MFKVGDKVKYKRDQGLGVGTVIELLGNGKFLKVRFEEEDFYSIQRLVVPTWMKLDGDEKFIFQKGKPHPLTKIFRE